MLPPHNFTMPRPGYFRKRRERLLREDPHCYWCRRELKLYPDYGKGGLKATPEDYATIDHLTSAFMGPRKDVRMRMRTLVLSCPSCNNARNTKEMKRHPWLVRWKSGSFPSPLRWLGKLLKQHRLRRFEG